MKFTDQGIIINIKNYGEGSAIVKVISKDHGICQAFVKFATSKKVKAIYQIGNLISFEYRSRVDDNLGSFFAVDLVSSYLGKIMFDKDRLNCARCLFFTIDQAFLEREEQQILFAELIDFLDKINDEKSNFREIIADYVKLELSILNILGYGVDLLSCAVTNSNQNLAFVSPKSARAVCYEAGLPYASKLLVLPNFLIANDVEFSRQDLLNGLKLSGYFLSKHVFEDDERFFKVRESIGLFGKDV